MLGSRGLSDICLRCLAWKTGAEQVLMGVNYILLGEATGLHTAKQKEAQASLRK